MNLITHDQVKSKIVQIRNQNVLLDNDVAELYGVETGRINEAVKRNTDKFPEGFLINLNKNEWENLKSQNAISSSHGGSRTVPTAFTEEGLYMLATILKSPKAVQTTIAIIKTFSQFKNLTRNALQLSRAENNQHSIEVVEKTTDIISDIFDNELIVSKQEDSFKIKLPFFEMTRKITKVQNTPEDKGDNTN